MSNEMDRPVALVTGASKGVGRGVVLGLTEAGFRVCATGRSIDEADLPPAVRRVPCDHTDDEQTARVFETVEREYRRLDLLVNSSWGGYERMVEDGRFTWSAPFWQQPLHRWHSMMDAGARSAFVCSAHAARLMIPRRKGMIVNISFWAAQRRIGNVIYGVAKAATDKLTLDSAEELRPFGIAVISLYPGLVRTEAVLAAGSALNLSNSESPQFIGRVIAGLFDAPDALNQSGKVIVAAEAAIRMGVTDIDGSSPRPISLSDLP